MTTTAGFFRCKRRTTSTFESTQSLASICSPLTRDPDLAEINVLSQTRPVSTIPVVVTIVIVPLLLSYSVLIKGVFSPAPPYCGYSKPSHSFVIMLICLVCLIFSSFFHKIDTEDNQHKKKLLVPRVKQRAMSSLFCTYLHNQFNCIDFYKSLWILI